MNSRDNETLIVLAGVAVLAVSLILPIAQRIASEHDVREVAVRAIEVKDKLLSSAESTKPLRVRMTDIVDGLSPDAALAEAELRDDKAPAPAIPLAGVDAATRPGAAPPVAVKGGGGVPSAADAPTEGRALEAEKAAPQQVVEARPRAPIAPRDNIASQSVERAGAAWIWDQ